MLESLRYYIDGPGEVLLVTSDFDQSEPDANKIFGIITAKKASIGASADLENVTGGRSLFPQRRYKTGQSATLELQDCEMDFRYAAITAGEDIVTGAQTVWAFGSDYRFTVPSAEPYTVTLPETPLADTLTVRFLGDGTVAAPATTAAAGTPSLAAKVLTFVAADAGKEFEAVFQYTSAATTRSVPFKYDSMPKTLKAIHKQPTFDNDNNITGYQMIEFFKLQPSPELSEEYEERAAFAPTIKLELLDPKRADKLIYNRTWVPVTA